jgi:hypothetical protein
MKCPQWHLTPTMGKVIFLTIAVLILPGLLLAQDVSNIPSKEMRGILLPNLPIKNGAIYYEQVVELGPVKSKEDLFWGAMEWIGTFYPDAKVTIKLDDKGEGKLLGKSLKDKYESKMGEYPLTVYTSFTLDLDIKDGRYWYRFYNFQTLDGGPFFKYNTMYRMSHEEKHWEEEESLVWLKNDIHTLTGLDQQVKVIVESLMTAMAKSSQL